jgi:hypothetical protein
MAEISEEKYSTIEVDLDEDNLEFIIKHFVGETLSKPSQITFEKTLEEIGDFPRALYNAVINEYCIKALKLIIETEGLEENE